MTHMYPHSTAWGEQHNRRNVTKVLTGGSSNGHHEQYSLFCRTEQAVEAKICNGYKFNLLSKLCKAIERAGMPLVDSMADSLAATLAHQAEVNQGYSSLCFFYGIETHGSAAQGGRNGGGNVCEPAAACCPEELMRKWQHCWAHSKLDMPAPQLHGWAVIKASSDMLAGSTGDYSAVSCLARACHHGCLPCAVPALTLLDDSEKFCRVPRMASWSILISVDSQQPCRGRGQAMLGAWLRDRAGGCVSGPFRC